MRAPKFLTDRIEKLNKDLDLAVMFNDDDRINYLQSQIGKLDDKIRTREEVGRESFYIYPKK